MHSLVIVVGGSVNERLRQFADHSKVEPYREFVEQDEQRSMAEHFGLRVGDLEALVTRMPEWAEVEAEIHGGQISYWSTENPNGRFDWYKVGGRFSGYLQLKEPREPSWFGRLVGRRASCSVNVARKGEVVVERLLEEPPFAVVIGESWLEQGWGEAALTDEEWRAQVGERFRLIPDDEMLTVIDIHS